MEYQCLNATEPLWGDSLLFTAIPQEFAVLILSTLEGWNAESILESPSGFEPETPGTKIQYPHHKVIAAVSANKSL